MEKALIFVFFFFFILLSGYIIVTETQALNMTGWNFSGSNFATSLIPNLGLIFCVVACAFLAYEIVKEKT